MSYILVENPGSYRVFHNTNPLTLTVPMRFSLGKTKEFSGKVKEVYSSYAEAEKDLRMLEEEYPDRIFGIKKTVYRGQNKKKYIAKLNWHGAIYTYETSAVSIAKAKTNVFSKLSKDIKITAGAVSTYYKSHPLGVFISELK